MGEGRSSLHVFLDSYRHTDNSHLQRALDVALGGSRTSWPNPAVGCVIVRRGEGLNGADLVVGEGFHARAGEPHAEVNALAAAGDLARGATAYVTLEPCNHTGRTGPCSQALIDAGVVRVIIGMADPNPRARGGADALRAAGVEVAFAADSTPFEYHLRGWLRRLETGRPFVTAKVGVTIDGSVSSARGVRTAITGVSGREVTDYLRARSNAIMVSSMTVRSDNPSLLATDSHGAPLPDQPLRVALSQTQLPEPSAALLSDGLASTALLVPAGGTTEGAAPNLVNHGRAADTDVSVIAYDATGGLRGALEALGSAGIGDLLVEPGPRLLAALVTEDLVDELVTVTAGGFLGQGSLHLWGGPPSGSSVLRPVDTAIHDDVVVTVWRPNSRFVGAASAAAEQEG